MSISGPFRRGAHHSDRSCIIGLWEEVPEGDKPPDPDEKMLILKYSDTEYLVHYPIGRTVTTRIYLKAPASLGTAAGILGI